MANASSSSRSGSSSIARTIVTLLVIAATSSLCLLPLLPSSAVASDLPVLHFPQHARHQADALDALDAPFHLLRRADSGAVQDAIANLSQSDPFTAAMEADDQLYIKGNSTGSDASAFSYTADTGDESQLPWNNNVYFQPSAATNGSQDGGWQELPETPGFVLNRTMAIYNSDRSGSGIMPFYITNNVYTPSEIKRAIIVWPGKPRDAWNYANLMRNALGVVTTNYGSWGIANDSVLILAPVFMAKQDFTAGAGHEGEFGFGGELWQAGSHTQLPALSKSLTSYEIMDVFTDMLADQTQFPNLNQIVVAGHSLGGQAAQRYAVLKKSKAYDYNMRYWIGNPGSWAWLTSNFAYSNTSCPIADSMTSPTSWPYGLNGNQTELTSYARKDVVADQAFVIQRYISRRVSYGLGLLDNGPGTTSCAAQWQGANHLDRGSQFILDFKQNQYSNYGFPANHTVDFLANISHQDYPMFSSTISLQRLFLDDYNTRYPDTAPTTNPGDTISGGGGGSGDGTRAYATPAHEKIAIGLLAGSIATVMLCYTMVFFTLSPNYDASWEKSMLAPMGQGSSRLR